MRRLGLVALAVALCGCAGGRSPPGSPEAAVQTGWRAVATAADRERLRNWRSAWRIALDQAHTTGHGAAIAADPALFDPDRSFDDPVPAAGEYHCRVVKLGSRGGVGIGYVDYPAFRCRVTRAGDRIDFTKLTGSQRPTGRIFPAEVRRGVFLGTVVYGDESRAVDYGRDATRDMAGFVERIGERRWRLVLPYLAFESTLDIIELVPAR